MAAAEPRSHNVRVPLRILVLSILGCAVVAGFASAGVTQRAQVGVSGRNSTHGYPASLYVVFKSPPDYNAGCCYDGDGAEWRGPRYVAEKKPDFDGDTKLDWGAYFETRVSTSEQAARESFIFKSWVDVSKTTVGVPHVVNGREVGTIPGVAVMTRSPGKTSAAFEAALGFPLCRGLFVSALFSATAPLNEETGLYGKYLVNGVPVSQWNRTQLETALQGVSLEGNLPAGKVNVRASGRVLSGVVSDCVGHPMPSVRVHVGATSTRTSGIGAYRLRLRHGGLVRVIAVGGGRSVRSAPIRVR